MTACGTGDAVPGTMGAMDTLLISADFFGYPQEIVKALEARGRSVLWCNDRPASDTKTKALVRLSPKLIERKSAEHFDRVFRQAAEPLSLDEQRSLFFTTANDTYRLGLSDHAAAAGEDHV